jgi:hypothetical protein
VIVGAYNFILDVVGNGFARLYLGGPQGLSSQPAWTGTPAVPFDGYGYAVTGTGDVNGDGFDDIVVGAPGDSTYDVRGTVWA